MSRAHITSHRTLIKILFYCTRVLTPPFPNSAENLNNSCFFSFLLTPIPSIKAKHQSVKVLLQPIKTNLKITAITFLTNKQTRYSENILAVVRNGTLVNKQSFVKVFGIIINDHAVIAFTSSPFATIKLIYGIFPPVLFMV